MIYGLFVGYLPREEAEKEFSLIQSKRLTPKKILYLSASNVDTKMSGPSLTLHFLFSSYCLSFFFHPTPLILSLSYSILNILPSVYIPFRMMTKHTAKRTQKRLIVLHQWFVGKAHGENLTFPF